MTLRLQAPKLAWPLPAVLGWAAAWSTFGVLGVAGAAPAWAFGLALMAPLLLAWSLTHWWRRLLTLAGFPLSLALLGATAAVPAWAWPLALLPVLLVYPLRAWRDAPFFPTERDALQGLDRQVVLPANASVLDAGCGLGDGLRALASVWPKARLHGVEWSRSLAILARRRVPMAQVDRGDMWTASWAGHDLVYLFQRPESMARAWAKACTEMVPGNWLVSLEFAVPEVAPWAILQAGARRAVYVYRVPAPAARESDRA
jgi:SAM-dependent methyltransferase